MTAVEAKPVRPSAPSTAKSEPVAPNAAQFLIIGERTNITVSPS